MRVALNGFGRIGRDVVRIIFEENRGIDLVAINTLGDINMNAHLFKYDSLYGKFEGELEAKEDYLLINGKKVNFYSEREPENLPWKELGVDLVIDSTGVFKDHAGLSKHIKAGAKKVIITAPAKDADITVVMGVNNDKYDSSKHHIISNASCTTNCLAPLTKIILEKFGIVKGLMTTVHAYTGDQNLHDNLHKDYRRARAAALSIVPTTTGAAKAVSLVLPEVKGKLNGYAIRVPVPTCSIVDVTFELEKEATVEEINEALKNASENELKEIMGFSDEPLVSIDYQGDIRSSIIDAEQTMVVGNMAKVVSWYDNEWGYSHRVVDLAEMVKKGL